MQMFGSLSIGAMMIIIAGAEYIDSSSWQRPVGLAAGSGLGVVLIDDTAARAKHITIG